MADWSDPRGPVTAYPAAADVRTGATDAGLRAHMLSVYNYMASGVLLTGIVAMLFARTEFAQNIFTNGGLLFWVIALAPLAFVMLISFGANRLSTGAMQAAYWAFAAVMGLSMASIFFRFTGTSIATAFFSTTVAFLGLSLYGYTTKRDLSGLGTFLIMGVFGLLGAIVLNMFLASGTLALVISVLGVLIFAGLTAYDTQKIKSIYFQLAGTEFLGKAAILGALELYLDFINMFQFLLSLMGSDD